MTPHSHFTKVHLKGYRNIYDTEATFLPGLNIIIGPNGCGKTNFSWLLANIDNDITNDIKISATIESVLFVEGNFLSPTEAKIYHTTNTVEKGFAKIEKKYNNDVLFLPNRLLIPFNLPQDLAAFDRPVNFYINKEYKHTTTDFKNHVVVLNCINTLGTQSIIPKNILTSLSFSPAILKKVKKYTPIEDIKIKYPKKSTDIKLIREEYKVSNLYYEFKINNQWFEWNELSDGIKRILWIVLQVTVFDYYNVFLIEEPELGIHPHQLNSLMGFIKEAAQQKQFIITTHSPEVLDSISANELDRIQIMRYDEARETAIITRIPPEKQAIIQKYMQEEGFLSDFWKYSDLEGGRL